MARRATSLGPKPSLFFFVLFCFFFCFPFFASKRQKTVFPLEKGMFLFNFECLPLFLLSLFWPPPFSISLSLSLSCSIISFLLLVFPFCFLFCSFFSLFLSFSFFFAFVSWKEQHQNIKLLLLFPELVSLLGVSCLAFSFQSLFLSLPCPDFNLCFLFNINVFGFKKQSWKTPIFGQKGGCNKHFFFMNLWFAKCEKVIVYFLPFSLPNFGWCSKNTLKIGCYYLGQVDCNLKISNLAQIITPQICARNFFQKESAETPILSCFLASNVL